MMISQKLYPMPFDVSGKDGVYVGRVRVDESITNGLDLWVVSDNLRKGAALNAPFKSPMFDTMNNGCLGRIGRF